MHEKLLVLIEHINVGMPCTVKRLQKGIAGVHKKGCESSQHAWHLRRSAMDGHRWHGWSHAAVSR
jgi:hypothetical protein